MLKSLNDITPAELQEINAMGAVFFTPKQIAIAMEFEVDPFVDACLENGSDCYNAFEGGRLKSEFEVRKSVVQLAKSGSSPAQTMALEMIKISIMKMMDK